MAHAPHKTLTATHLTSHLAVLPAPSPVQFAPGDVRADESIVLRTSPLGGGGSWSMVEVKPRPSVGGGRAFYVPVAALLPGDYEGTLFVTRTDSNGQQHGRWKDFPMAGMRTKGNGFGGVNYIFTV